MQLPTNPDRCPVCPHGKHDGTCGHAMVTSRGAERCLCQGDKDAERVGRLVAGIEAVKKETIRRGLGKGKGGHGGMPCPMPGCKGRVAFIVYTMNGHLMASCNKANCLNVRE